MTLFAYSPQLHRDIKQRNKCTRCQIFKEFLFLSFEIMTSMNIFFCTDYSPWLTLFLHGPVIPEVYQKICSSLQDENLHEILQRNIEQKVRKQRQININFHHAPVCLFPIYLVPMYPYHPLYKNTGKK